MNRGARSIASGPHPCPLPPAGEGENALRVSRDWAWGWQEWKGMACAARFGHVAGGHMRLPLPRERVGVRGSRRGSWEAALALAPCSPTMNPGFRGARRPPLRQAGRPPLRTGGSGDAGSAWIPGGRKGRTWSVRFDSVRPPSNRFLGRGYATPGKHPIEPGEDRHPGIPPFAAFQGLAEFPPRFRTRYA